jgi:transcriptional regulator of acetoin/glycerol metabolism
LVELMEDNKISCTGFDDDFLEKLSALAWPGNVRELRNTIECALIRAAGRRITVEDLTDAPTGSPSSMPPGRNLSPTGVLPALADIEKEHIHQVLKACSWNRSAAARILGIDRRTLFSKIQRYGLVG